MAMGKSHPMWVRGLKHLFDVHYTIDSVSHPMWVRGLKLHSGEDNHKFLSRTPCGCVD